MENPRANGVRTFQSACVALTGGQESPPSVKAESPQTKVGANVLVSPCRVRAREDARPHPKAESLSHTSVGQGTQSCRPTKRHEKFSKAVSLAHERRAKTPVTLRKAFSLDGVADPGRRALPYANMRKAFSLVRQP